MIYSSHVLYGPLAALQRRTLRRLRSTADPRGNTTQTTAGRKLANDKASHAIVLKFRCESELQVNYKTA